MKQITNLKKQLTFIRSASTSLASISLVATLLTSCTHQSGESLIPKKNVEEFIFKRLDLSTFPNSFHPRRLEGKKQNMRHFADFGLKPTNITSGLLEVETPDWFNSVQIIKRADINKDGLEDLAITFTDSAKEGTYRSQEDYIVTRYSDDGDLVAISLKP